MDSASTIVSAQAPAASRVDRAHQPVGTQQGWPVDGTTAAPSAGRGDIGFAGVLTAAQLSAAASRPPSSRWASLGFLTSSTVPLLNWRGVQSSFSLLPQLLTTASGLGLNSVPNSKPLSLADFPRPPQDNGWGIHWIPTVSQSPEVVDRFVNEAAAMGMKWVVFLNEGAQVGGNDYLVQRLVRAGIEPIMRVYTPGMVPVEGDLKDMAEHYRKLGVNYFQLYNEPNLKVETNGQEPDVERYLNLWVPAAQRVIEGGGLPGIGALSPQGEADDYTFLQTALSRLKTRGQADVLDRAWVALHNYTGPRSLSDPDGFLRFRKYDAIVRSELGRSMPIISTEGGTHVTEQTSEVQQVAAMTGAYNYMRHKPEAYYFANTYWIIANGPDSSWDAHALIRPGGATALASALKQMASGSTV
jgi:hypothetical protein